MAVVETERHGQVLVVRMNRPDRLNALNTEMRTELARVWTEFRHDKEAEVAIFTGTGRGFCAGEDMKESLEKGKAGGERPKMEDPFMSGALEKPVIAAVHGFAMGGGFMLVERTDLRVAVRPVSPADERLTAASSLNTHTPGIPAPSWSGGGGGAGAAAGAEVAAALGLDLAAVCASAPTAGDIRASAEIAVRRVLLRVMASELCAG